MCDQRTEVPFASFLSVGFTAMAVINPPERKLAKRTSVQWTDGEGVLRDANIAGTSKLDWRCFEYF